MNLDSNVPSRPDSLTPIFDQWLPIVEKLQNRIMALQKEWAEAVDLAQKGLSLAEAAVCEVKAAYLRGLEAAAVACEERASCKSLVGTPRGKEANLCAAAIRALARG